MPRPTRRQGLGHQTGCKKRILSLFLLNKRLQTTASDMIHMELFLGRIAMQRAIIWLAVLILVMGLAGCAKKPVETEASEEWRLQSLEKDFLNFKEQQRRKEQSQEETRKELEEQIEELQARINQMGPDEKPMPAGEIIGEAPEENPLIEGEDIAEAQDESMDPDQSSMEDKVMNLPEKEAPEQDLPMAVDLSKSEPTDTEQGLYEKGLYLTRHGKPAEGRKVLNTFLSRYPKSRLVPNALYWLGETYYAQGKYAQAILSFKDVVKRFPKHHKAAAALLKIGYSYVNLGDQENARFYLNILLKDYSSSDPAQLGRKKLNRIE
jgi:tol-pal system protein YbgF